MVAQHAPAAARRRATAALLLAGLGAFAAPSTVTANPAAGTAGSADLATLVSAGRAIYESGRLADGSELVGRRADGREIRGAAAACASCHRPSGYGSVEGSVWVPPITGESLFGGNQPGVVVRKERRFNSGISIAHAAYSDDELAALVGDGKRTNGRALLDLMPRYGLPPQAMAALTAYLKTLSRGKSAAVSGSTIRIATVITPEVDPARREALKATLRAFVDQRNVYLVAGLRKKIPAVERKLRSRRTWELAFWELAGPPDTWPAQLAARQASAPVFALLSGTSDTTWQPMADFCEQQRVACWFPTLEIAPIVHPDDRLGLYFSAAAQLDAAVVAEALAVRRPHAVSVVLPTGARSEATRDLLADALKIRGQKAALAALDVDNRLAHELAELGPRDALVIWGNRELAARFAGFPAPKASVYWMNGDDPHAADSLPAAWHARLVRVDRFEKPEIRDANLKRFRDWSKFYRIGVVDERLQSESFFAANFLAMGFTDILNNLDPLYLVERGQDTLSMREAERVQMEVQSMMMGGGSHGPAVNHADNPDVKHVNLDLLRSRQGTTLYPRLSLGPGQHFASQGAYLIDGSGAHWTVPGKPGTFR